VLLRCPAFDYSSIPDPNANSQSRS